MVGKKLETARTALMSFALLLAAVVFAPPPASSAGLMEACAPDIGSLCKGVSEGRGRISACLFAHSNKVSPACKPELDKVTSSRMFESRIPQGVHSLNDTAYEASLRKVCAADFKKLCNGVEPGDDRLLACLYAWNTKVTPACRTEAKTALDHLK